MKKPELTQINDNEIDTVSGAGKSGYVAGYRVAKELGASDETADTVGKVVSFVQDFIT